MIHNQNRTSKLEKPNFGFSYAWKKDAVNFHQLPENQPQLPKRLVLSVLSYVFQVVSIFIGNLFGVAVKQELFSDADVVVESASELDFAKDFAGVGF